MMSPLSSSPPPSWEPLRSQLSAHGQLHLLSPLPPAEAAGAYAAQLEQLNLSLLQKLFHASTSLAPASGSVTPFEGVTRLDELADAGAAERREGLSLIAQGKVAALLLAGGSGTRLGFDAPKGCFNIGMPSGKSLFQYHAEKVLAVRQLAAAHEGIPLAKVSLPLLVMTSAANDEETRAFFAKHANFGLPEQQLHFFPQGMLPAFDNKGRILRASHAELSLSPNGNGGVYLSLLESGMLDHLEAAGVTSVFQFGVDNVLCHVAEPTFIGFCSRSGAECGVKTIAKAHPHEKVGVLALVDGRPSVVEYSEISREMAEAVRPSLGDSGDPNASNPPKRPKTCAIDHSSGEARATQVGQQLLYGDAHICVNWFALPFLRRFATAAMSGGEGYSGSCALPLHVARKKVSCIDPDTGTMVFAKDMAEPNAIKLEMFIFDTFPHATRLVALQVPREEEFAPVKNAPGSASDCPETARAALSALCIQRLRAAGGSVRTDATSPDEANGEERLLEISSLVSYAGEGLASRVAGKEFELPAYIDVEQ